MGRPGSRVRFAGQQPRDHKGNVWASGKHSERHANPEVLTNFGKFLLQLGKHRAQRDDIKNFWQPTKIFADPTDDEVYVSDGYGNRRVIVLDADSSKRHWGAVREQTERQQTSSLRIQESPQPSKQFSTVHCVIVSIDSSMYVCDRVNNRIQVFRKDGTFVKEAIIDAKKRSRLFRCGIWFRAIRSRPTVHRPHRRRRSMFSFAARSKC